MQFNIMGRREKRHNTIKGTEMAKGFDVDGTKGIGGDPI